MSVYLTDANFLVALINPSDKFHLSATNLYNELVNHNPNIVIPDDNQMVKCLTANGVSCLNFVASP